MKYSVKYLRPRVPTFLKHSNIYPRKLNSTPVHVGSGPEWHSLETSRWGELLSNSGSVRHINAKIMKRKINKAPPPTI